MKRIFISTILCLSFFAFVSAWCLAQEADAQEENIPKTQYERLVQSAKASGKLIMIFFYDKDQKWQRNFESGHARPCASGVLYYGCDKNSDPDKLFSKFSISKYPVTIFVSVNKDGKQNKNGSFGYNIQNPENMKSSHFGKAFNQSMMQYRDYLAAVNHVYHSMNSPTATASTYILKLLQMKSRYENMAKSSSNKDKSAANMANNIQKSLDGIEKSATEMLKLVDRAFKEQKNYQGATAYCKRLMQKFAALPNVVAACKEKLATMEADPDYQNWKNWEKNETKKTKDRAEKRKEKRKAEKKTEEKKKEDEDEEKDDVW